LRKEEELNGEEEIHHASATYGKEHRYEPYEKENRYEPIQKVKSVESSRNDEEYVVNEQKEPFEFEATQAPTRPAVIQPIDEMIAKPASKKKVNPFATKPKDPSFLLSNTTVTPLEELKAATKLTTPAVASTIAPQKRKQIGIMAFASVAAEKKAKGSKVPAEGASEQSEIVKEKKASNSSFIPKLSVKDHFAKVASIAEKDATDKPNKSIIPENESEEEMAKRMEVEKMFENDNNKENPARESKGKAPSNPKSLLKNQGWAMEDGQELINQE
jgi:hypothetical protein